MNPLSYRKLDPMVVHLSEFGGFFFSLILKCVPQDRGNVLPSDSVNILNQTQCISKGYSSGGPEFMGKGSFLTAFLLQCAITALEEDKLSLCHTYGRFAALRGCVNVTVLFKIIA